MFNLFKPKQRVVDIPAAIKCQTEIINAYLTVNPLKEIQVVSQVRPRISFINKDKQGGPIGILSIDPEAVIIDLYDISTGFYVLVTTEVMTQYGRQNLQIIGKDQKPTQAYRQEVVSNTVHSKIELSDENEIREAWHVLHPNQYFRGFEMRQEYLKKLEEQRKLAEERKRKEEEDKAIAKREEELKNKVAEQNTENDQPDVFEESVQTEEAKVINMAVPDPEDNHIDNL